MLYILYKNCLMEAWCLNKQESCQCDVLYEEHVRIENKENTCNSELNLLYAAVHFTYWTLKGSLVFKVRVRESTL